MRVCFAYVTDRNGFELAGLSAVSVALSQPQPCHVHVFCHKFEPQPDAWLLKALAKLGGTISFSTIGDTAIEQYRTHGHVTTPSLLKLSAAAQLMAEYDRIVYLDNDILVFDDLKIEQINFGSMPIAAVTDMDLTETGVLRNLSWTHPSSRTQHTGSYFNSGVMIFESSKWRSEFLASYALALDRHDPECSYKLQCTSIDQCALNATFNDNWLKLPATYNMQAGAKFTDDWQKASARHYCGPRKCVPLQPFRSDARDVRYVDAIGKMLGRPSPRFSWLYGILYSLNRARHFRGDLPMRNFLAAHGAEFSRGSVSSERRDGVLRVREPV